MLATPSPYPQMGSHALYEACPEPGRGAAPGQLRAVRILGWEIGGAVCAGAEDRARISLLGHAAASGCRRVPLAELLDATAWSEAEEAEYAGLDRELAGSSLRSKRHKAMAARQDDLLRRHRHAEELARQLRSSSGALRSAPEAGQEREEAA